MKALIKIKIGNIYLLSIIYTMMVYALLFISKAILVYLQFSDLSESIFHISYSYLNGCMRAYYATPTLPIIFIEFGFSYKLYAY